MTSLVTQYDVSNRITAYGQMERRWELPTALWGGTDAMRKKNRKYLPQDPEETYEAYASRLERSFLFNGFKKTVNTMVGKVFSKPLVLKDDVPQQLKDLSESIDPEGRRIDVFAEDVFRDALKYGLCHIFVDMPQVPPGATLAQEQEIGARPYWVKVTPQQLIGWKSRKVGSRQILTSIRMFEQVVEDDGDYGEKEVQRIREVYLTPSGTVAYRLWVLTNKMDARGRRRPEMEWQITEQGNMSIPYIPLFTVYTQRESFMLATPPLEDLCWINVAHWQSSSDQRHILHVARVPILFGNGLGENADKIVVGPNRLIAGPEGSDLKYVEHAGHAINSGRDDIKELESQMKIMGLELLLPNTSGGGQTATAKSLDYADVNSPLQFMAWSLGDTLEACMQCTADWMKLGEGGSIKVNTDYGITLRDSADVQALIQARLGGEISDETFWAELKRRNILSEDFDAVAEKARLEEEREEDLERMEDEAAVTLETANGGVPNVGSDVTGGDDDA